MGDLDVYQAASDEWIGEGGFGVVYEGVGPQGKPVAIKKDLAISKVVRPVLEHEYNVYKALVDNEYTPNVHAYGRQGIFNILVMDLLGPSLDNRFKMCANRFSLRTIARLGIGMLNAIESIHGRGFIHRDIKPNNFVLGRGSKSDVVYLIDFALARRWRYLNTGADVSSTPVDGGPTVGTPKFASINAHLGKEQTRRDDLHSLVYTILFFARASGLPWDQIKTTTGEHYNERVLKKKCSWDAKRLCQDLPHEFEEFAAYCFGLEVDVEPDYCLLREILMVVVHREEYNDENKFEWEQLGWKASGLINRPAPPVKQMPPPSVKRGDVVLLKLIPGASLDYEYPRRQLDSSFLPHVYPFNANQLFPYRPAIVREIVMWDDDDMYFSLNAYSLVRRADLDGLATRRRGRFRPLKTLVATPSGQKVPSDDIFVYEQTLFGGLIVKL